LNRLQDVGATGVNRIPQKDLFPEKSKKKNNNVKKIGANLFLIFNSRNKQLVNVINLTARFIIHVMLALFHLVVSFEFPSWPDGFSRIYENRINLLN